MKRTIKTAIKAAGLNAADFNIFSDSFESILDTRKGNAQVRKVMRELSKAGVKVSSYTCGHGGIVANLNRVTSIAHEVDFNHPASIHHY